MNEISQRYYRELCQEVVYSNAHGDLLLSLGQLRFHLLKQYHFAGEIIEGLQKRIELHYRYPQWNLIFSLPPYWSTSLPILLTADFFKEGNVQSFTFFGGSDLPSLLEKELQKVSLRP